MIELTVPIRLAINPGMIETPKNLKTIGMSIACLTKLHTLSTYSLLSSLILLTILLSSSFPSLCAWLFRYLFQIVRVSLHVPQLDELVAIPKVNVSAKNNSFAYIITMIHWSSHIEYLPFFIQ